MPELLPTVKASFSVLGCDWIDRIENADMPSLGEGPRDASLCNAIAEDNSSAWNEIPAPNQNLIRCGLWLLAGDLDQSHSISQAIETAEGSFWHGIMHRREADFGNAKYWFRRVGSHVVFERLAEALQMMHTALVPVRMCSGMNGCC